MPQGGGGPSGGGAVGVRLWEARQLRSVAWSTREAYYTAAAEASIALAAFCKMCPRRRRGDTR